MLREITASPAARAHGIIGQHRPPDPDSHPPKTHSHTPHRLPSARGLNLQHLLVRQIIHDKLDRSCRAVGTAESLQQYPVELPLYDPSRQLIFPSLQKPPQR